MTLKLINIGPKWTRVVLVSAAIVCVIFAWFFIRWNLANVIASRAEAGRPESPLIAELVTGIAPSDPSTHLLAAAVLERTFNADDLSLSLLQYETAAALSPRNYLMWMNVGRARGLNGDAEGSLSAYRKALELAPHYASVKWTYGNALVRSGSTDEGLALMAEAAQANPEYSGPAIATALQISENRVDEVRRTMGETSAINAALVPALVSAKRFDDALDAWRRLPPDEKKTQYRSLGESLVNKAAEGNMYRMAAQVRWDLVDENRPAVAAVTNGGFEETVKPGSSDMFEWRISEGTHPQIGLSDAVKRSGQYSLLLVFNSFDTAGLRSIDQTIAVEPGVDHELEIFYRSDLRSNAVLKWEVLDAADPVRLAISEPLAPAADWSTIRIRFKTSSDGILIRLLREGCNGPTCPMNGRVSFDDISLRRL